MVSAYLDRRAGVLGPGACDGHGPLGVGVRRQADEELSAGEEDVGAGQEGRGRPRLHDHLVQLLLKDRSHRINLKFSGNLDQKI